MEGVDGPVGYPHDYRAMKEERPDESVSRKNEAVNSKQEGVKVERDFIDVATKPSKTNYLGRPLISRSESDRQIVKTSK